MHCQVLAGTQSSLLSRLSGYDGHFVVREKKTKDYAFQRQFHAKPSNILGCPGFVVRTIQRSHAMLWCACRYLLCDLVVNNTLKTLLCAGRYLLRDLVVDYTLKKYPSWAAVDTAVSREGWKLITLLR